jgi:hypothetical protein
MLGIGMSTLHIDSFGPILQFILKKVGEYHLNLNLICCDQKILCILSFVLLFACLLWKSSTLHVDSFCQPILQFWKKTIG